MNIFTTLTDAVPNSPVAWIFSAVLILVLQWRGIIMLSLVPCTLALALFASADRSERATRLFEILLNRLARGGKK
ncbi:MULTISPECIES: hypothetical protein [Rhodococcus]|uniref:hypothetical protein n=1 Tax=Rhodococcus TaxID=1827 RepID=UPI0007B46302|nr:MULTISPECIES: hypothetical protein [Rhodococcus]KZL30485.1 hypothetical protein A3852_23140 [Rhodococcus qingshengii]MCE4165050.1 hypothetical protein [Rhodococcus sp. Ni2]